MEYSIRNRRFRCTLLAHPPNRQIGAPLIYRVKDPRMRPFLIAPGVSAIAELQGCNLRIIFESSFAESW